VMLFPMLTQVLTQQDMLAMLVETYQVDSEGDIEKVPNKDNHG